MSAGRLDPTGLQAVQRLEFSRGPLQGGLLGRAESVTAWVLVAASEVLLGEDAALASRRSAREVRESERTRVQNGAPRLRSTLLVSTREAGGDRHQ